MKGMLIAQYNGYGIMKPSAFTLVPHKPHFQCTISSATGHVVTQEKENSLVINLY